MKKRYFSLFFLAILFFSSVNALFLKSVDKHTHTFYTEYDFFFDNFFSFDVKTTPELFTITFSRKIDFVLKTKSDIQINNNKIFIPLMKNYFWYRAVKHKNKLQLLLYKYPVSYRYEEPPYPAFVTYLRYKKYIDKTSGKKMEKSKKTGAIKPKNKKNVVKSKSKDVGKKKKVVSTKKIKKKIWTIVIDPGHGGKDSGARGPYGILEKNIVLKIGLKVYKMLKKIPNIKPIITRKGDYFITLRGRALIANKHKADLFISIHANAVGGSYRKKLSRHGTETFFLSQSYTNESRATAIRENEAIKFDEEGKKGDVLAQILSDLAQDQYLKESSDFAYIVQRNLVSATGWRDLGVKQNYFYVLRFSYVPAVLIETGFVSNPKEAVRLNSDKYQKIIAKQIVRSIKEYIKKHERVYAKR